MALSIDPLQAVVTIVFLVGWFARLEFKVSASEKYLEKQDITIAKMREKHETLESDLIKDLNEVKQALARIEGQLIGGKYGHD
jgi:hypothetical protein